MAKLFLFASGALGVMVTCAGIAFLVTKELAGQGFGVPAPVGDGVWQQIAGTREVAIGLFIMWLAVTRQARVLSALMLMMVIIPLGDVYFSVSRGAPIYLVAQHVIGSVGMIVLGVGLQREV